MDWKAASRVKGHFNKLRYIFNGLTLQVKLMTPVGLMGLRHTLRPQSLPESFSPGSNPCLLENALFHTIKCILIASICWAVFGKVCNFLKKETQYSVGILLLISPNSLKPPARHQSTGVIKSSLPWGPAVSAGRAPGNFHPLGVCGELSVNSGWIGAGLSCSHIVKKGYGSSLWKSGPVGKWTKLISSQRQFSRTFFSNNCPFMGIRHAPGFACKRLDCISSHCLVSTTRTGLIKHFQGVAKCSGSYKPWG